ncbi:MAG: cytochrome c biogenesis protein ResB [Bacteroidaceae bacterium]|nr:cytochrome c biogenesis protein ResB [Bacteroidaceae bacterium]
MKTSVPSKLPFILVFFLVIAIAVATVLENRYDTHYAMQHVYGAWWFIGLWAILALAGCWLIYKKKMWRQPSVFLLHLSFLIILIGALTTHITSHRGMVHLREGETSRSYWAKDNQGLYTLTEQMPFYLALKDFQVLYDADGITPSDYVSQVVIATKEGKEETSISMNNIGRVKGFRIYQTSFDDDLAGSVFTISYDPWGTGITYMGYILLAISMIWVSFKRNEKLKEKKEKLSKNSQLSTFNFNFQLFCWPLPALLWHLTW